jgi:hypothetical protein
MSTRPNASIAAIVNGNMTTTLTSIVTIINNLSMMSYAYEWSGASPVGTISVQVSDDYSEYPNGQVNNPGTWNTLPLSTGNSVAVTGNSGNGGIDILQTGFYAIRTVYTPASGTGTLQCEYQGKVS